MSVVSLSRRIEKLEAVRGSSDITALSDEVIAARLSQLQDEISLSINHMGGKEAAVAAMRMAGAPPVDFRLIEEWTP